MKLNKLKLFTGNDIELELEVTLTSGVARGAAKLRLYLKIWEGKIILRCKNFRKGLKKSCRSTENRVASKKKVVKKFLG